MQITFKVFSTRSGKSVILQVEERKYVFGVFEGFQRYCIEAGFSMVAASAFFLSSKHDIPGLIGALLTLSESKTDLFRVVFPHSIDCSSIYSFAKHLELKWTVAPEYEDEYISVRPYCASEKVNYMLSFKGIRGIFHPELVPDGIPKKLYKELSAGKRVSVNGIEYCGSNYCSPPSEIGSLCILFSDAVPKPLLDMHPTTFICTSSEAALRLTELNLGVWFIEDNYMVEYTGWYSQQLLLNDTNPSFLLPMAYPNEITSQDEMYIKNLAKERENVIKLRTGPEMQYNKKTGFRLILSDASHGAYKHPCTSLKSLSSSAAITFLGTGCSQPSKYRNVSSILLETADTAILLDCGEDTLSQILRLRGSLDVLKKLKVIYISHSHSDHHLGTSSVILSSPGPVTVVGPSACRQFIQEQVGTLHNYIDTHKSKALEQEFYEYPSRKLSSCILTVELYQFVFRICGCRHSVDSTSVCVEDTSTDIRVSYSGDTRPSELFAKLSEGADLMIHESTFLDCQYANALKTNHSTESEAKRVYEASGARELILTHVSNRNPILVEQAPYAADFYYHEVNKR